MNFNAAYNTVLKESIILQYKNSIPPPTNSRLTPTHTLSQPNKSRKHSIQKPGVSIVSLESQNTVKKKKNIFWHQIWRCGFKPWPFILMEPIWPGTHTASELIFWFNQILLDSVQGRAGEDGVHSMSPACWSKMFPHV